MATELHANPGSLLMLVALTICAVTVLVLLVQLFVPCVRRFYAESALACLRFLRVRPARQQPLASLLGTCTAWLHFVWGFCLIPLCYTLALDIVAPAGGIAGLGWASLGLALAVGSMLLSSLIALLWVLLCWLARRKNLTPTPSDLPPIP